MARYDFTEYLEHQQALAKLEADAQNAPLRRGHFLHVCKKCGRADNLLADGPPSRDWRCTVCNK